MEHEVTGLGAEAVAAWCRRNMVSHRFEPGVLRAMAEIESLHEVLTDPRWRMWPRVTWSCDDPTLACMVKELRLAEKE